MTLNGPLVVLLKKGKGVSPLELLDIETFNVRWQPCLAAKNNELAAEKALYQQDGKNAKEDVCTQIAEGSLAPQPSKYPKGSREYLGFKPQTLDVLLTHCYAFDCQVYGIDH